MCCVEKTDRQTRETEKENENERQRKRARVRHAQIQLPFIYDKDRVLHEIVLSKPEKSRRHEQKNNYRLKNLHDFDLNK